jgi:hypothetical protein
MPLLKTLTLLAALSGVLFAQNQPTKPPLDFVQAQPATPQPQFVRTLLGEKMFSVEKDKCGQCFPMADAVAWGYGTYTADNGSVKKFPWLADVVLDGYIVVFRMDIEMPTQDRKAIESGMKKSALPLEAVWTDNYLLLSRVASTHARESAKYCPNRTCDEHRRFDDQIREINERIAFVNLKPVEWFIQAKAAAKPKQGLAK